MKRLGGGQVELITNGFDKTDFTLSLKRNDKFILGHYGLLNHLRNPKNLWKALDMLCRENPEFKIKLEIHLSGNIDQEVLNEIESYPMLSGKVKQLGYLSHAEVLSEYNEADVLLLLLFNSKSGVGNYPGKIFEYFAAKKPILAFGPKESDTEKLMSATRSGLYFTYEESEIKDSIMRLYEKKIQFNNANISRFSRSNLTSDLAKLLNKL